MTKKKSDRKRSSSGSGSGGQTSDPHGEGGPDEAASFIAETAGELVRLARSQGLEMLGHLLRMAVLEAEEYLRVRGKQKLS